MKMFFVLFCAAITLLATDAALARGNPRFDSNRGIGPFICDNGRSYELRGTVIYVDGIPARNYVNYDIWGAADGSGISVRENGVLLGHCRMANPPPPPEPPKHWDNYVKVCNPNCHWETQEIP